MGEAIVHRDVAGCLRGQTAAQIRGLAVVAGALLDPTSTAEIAPIVRCDEDDLTRQLLNAAARARHQLLVDLITDVRSTLKLLVGDRHPEATTARAQGHSVLRRIHEALEAERKAGLRRERAARKERLERLERQRKGARRAHG